MPFAAGIDGSDDPTQNLLSFNLVDLAKFTLEKTYSSNASEDLHLFFVGRDDVHSILAYLISRCRESLYLNMFGYDDDDLNNIIMKKVIDPSVKVVITLDKSQAGSSKHESQLLDLDKKEALSAFNTHFVVGQSATHQISHTKGFVLDSKVGAEGSTNWSSSGEGTFVKIGTAGGAGYKAQNNTQTVFTDSDSVARFQQELLNEHLLARDNEAATEQPSEPRQRRLTMKQVAAIRARGQPHPAATGFGFSSAVVPAQQNT